MGSNFASPFFNMELSKKLSLLNPQYPNLNKRLANYLEALAHEDYDGILMLTYPGIYEWVPRNIMREKIIQTFHDEETEFSMDIFEIDTIGKMIEHDKGRFIKINYTLLMAMRFLKKENDPEKEAGYQTFMLRMLRSFYGEENIWYEATTESYCFYQKKMMIGIEDSKSPKWTFLNQCRLLKVLQLFIVH